MDYLPQNPAILVSSINMLLRDAERSPIELGERPCPLRLRGNNTEPEKIKAILYDAGYVYSEEQEQFRPIGYVSSKNICRNEKKVVILQTFLGADTNNNSNKQLKQ